MKKYNRLLILGISLIMISFLMVGCGGNDSSSRNSSTSEVYSSNDFGGTIEDANAPAEVSDLEPEKIIVHINLDFETTDFENSTKLLNDAIAKYKAYTESSNVSYNTGYNNKSYRTGYYTVRVPKNSVADFKSELAGVGNMMSESVRKEDATKEYYDTEARLKVVTTKEQRLLELLEKATKIEDIIALENQLSETVAQKEILKASLIHIDDQVDFSTFYINVYEVDRLSSTQTTETTFGTRLLNAITDSGATFVRTSQNFIITLIYLLPYLVAFAIIGYPIYLLLKRNNRLPKDRPKLFSRKKKKDL